VKTSQECLLALCKFLVQEKIKVGFQNLVFFISGGYRIGAALKSKANKN
jgi:hypothetical protein